MIFEKNDLDLLNSKGISLDKAESQLDSFRKGFPYLTIIQAADYKKGICKLNNTEEASAIDAWNEYLKGDSSILKFVPASGAASRMFKDLFEFLDGTSDSPVKTAEKSFFEDIQNFAFYKELDSKCNSLYGKNIENLISEGSYKSIVEALLNKKGLNYGSLPKGLLSFHTYPGEIRTPLQEHLVEGALYASGRNGKAGIHFTVSTEHRSLFEKHAAEVAGNYENILNTQFELSFSEQKPSTDTMAADSENNPFRENGEILFRPGGHGALIENLNDLDADIIFIKNIDNVVPDHLKKPTIEFKKTIGGKLVQLQARTFKYLKELESGESNAAKLSEMLDFCESELNNFSEGARNEDLDSLKSYLISKFNRPIRVCGMVVNTGEPGGGPFITVNSDGSSSTQILESSQIDLSNPTEKEKMMMSSHFNPVDLVCGVRDYKGNKFNLLNFVDKNTGFISSKSKNGKELKALELPGLWNGAMSDWNTIFVEVPIETFNPVKTVNDLLRDQHQ